MRWIGTDADDLNEKEFAENIREELESLGFNDQVIDDAKIEVSLLDIPKAFKF